MSSWLLDVYDHAWPRDRKTALGTDWRGQTRFRNNFSIKGFNMVSEIRSNDDCGGQGVWVADGHGGYEDLGQAIRAKRTCISVGGAHLMLVCNLEDAARAIQPNDGADSIVSMPDNLGLVDSHPNRSVQRLIELLRSQLGHSTRRIQ